VAVDKLLIIMAKTTTKPADYSHAHRHLSRRDVVLKRLVKELGPCTLQHNPDGFAVLARSIVAQQISSKAAKSISLKLQKNLGRRGLTARAIADASDETMRSAGLSAGKLRALRDLADKVLSGAVALKELPDMADEEVIESLIQVHGIGPWTAEMFLIFSLGRLDILPTADLGLRAGVKRQYELADLPDKASLVERGEPWRPFRTVATWYFWRSFGNVPQSH
jgi:DNA-3-methyladenine glycosylase II